MTESPLAGTGVLVTRPEHQADDLVDAIEDAGGRAFRFPVFDIVARSAADIDADSGALDPADTVIFVSANAVRFGLSAVTGAPTRPEVAAIGPATARALDEAGIGVDIRPAGGFNSEHLLADSAFEDVAGRVITIVRGESGRELLAETLRSRGANVQYLSVYSMRPHDVDVDALEALRRALRQHQVGAVTIMSVKSFEYLETLLPDDCLDAIAGTRLVAPGGRVIQTLAERLPGARCVESPGPDAQSMVDALIASLQDDP